MDTNVASVVKHQQVGQPITADCSALAVVSHDLVACTESNSAKFTPATASFAQRFICSTPLLRIPTLRHF
jgi:hypothetical protein